MTTATRNARKSLPPATGKVRWINRPTGPTLYGRFAVAAETKRGTVEAEYDIAAVTDKDGKVVGLGLAKDDDTIYHIDISQPWGWTCDCPDGNFNRTAGTCKHCRAARQALAVAGITLPEANKPQPIPCDLEDL